MKNLIYAGIIIVCLLVAGIIMFAGRSGGSGGVDSISSDEQIWVICLDCQTSHEMGKQDYYKQLEEKAKENTGVLMALYLTCEKCGKAAVTEAVKCEKCGEVFRKGAVRGDFADRCPKCKFSKTEAIRKERLQNQ